MTLHRSRGILLAGALVAAILPSCGGGGGGSSCVATSEIAGLWSGTANDEVARGTINVDLAFTQKGCALGGTWKTDFPAPGTGESQNVDGFINGAEVRFQVRAPTVSCRTRVVGTLDSATQITGTYATHNCSQSDSGAFTITFQGALPTPAATPTFIIPTAAPTATRTPTPG